MVAPSPLEQEFQRVRTAEASEAFPGTQSKAETACLGGEVLLPCRGHSAPARTTGSWRDP